MPCVNRRLRDLCKRTDCHLWKEPTLRLQLASVDSADARAARQLVAEQATLWLFAKRAQLSDVRVSMLMVSPEHISWTRC